MRARPIEQQGVTKGIGANIQAAFSSRSLLAHQAQTLPEPGQAVASKPS